MSKPTRWGLGRDTNTELRRLREENERHEKTIAELGLYVAKLRKVVDLAWCAEFEKDNNAAAAARLCLRKALRELDEVEK